MTKIDEKGHRKGKMPLPEVADLLRQVFDWDAERRQVRLISRFEESPFIAWGQNGGKWVAVKAIPPAEYYLVSVSGKAYPVRLPQLVVKVGSHTSTFLFWTADEKLGLESKLHPLMIGNIDDTGRVCLGTTGLRCQTPDDIDRFVRQVIEAPSTGTYLPGKRVDKLYQSLTCNWAPGIGRKHGITLAKLIAEA